MHDDDEPKVLMLNVRRVDGGYIAICECGHRSEPQPSTALLAYHVESTWSEHILEKHLGGES